MTCKTLTSENFAETIKTGTVIVDFWASWCGPCRQFKPIFEAVSEEVPDVTFGLVNTDEQASLRDSLQIMSIPTVMVFRDGLCVYNKPGAMPKQALLDLLQQVSELDMEEVRKNL